VVTLRHVRLAYQPPAYNIFLSEQINHQPAILFPQNKTTTSQTNRVECEGSIAEP
jgi:hypothetical protein